MIEVDVEADPRSWAQYQRTIQNLARIMDKPVEDVLKQQGRILANDFAFRTVPFGLDAGTGKEMQNIVLEKIFEIYKSVGWIQNEVWDAHGEPASKYIVKLIRTGRFTEARKELEGPLRPSAAAGRHLFIAVGRFDWGKLHRRYRFKKGKLPIMVVQNFSEVRSYARSTAYSAGWAKGAFVQAGIDLDGKIGGTRAKGSSARPAKWITRHSSSPGAGRLRRIGRGFAGYIRTAVKYARQALPFAEEMKAIDIREETARKELQKQIDLRAKREMRRRGHQAR